MNPLNPFAAAGAGRHRQPWRIREELDRRGLSMADVARALGLARSTVSRTVQGANNSRRVLAYLRDLGIPLEYLSLPEDMMDHTGCPAGKKQ